MQFKEKTLARIYSFKFLYFLLFEKGMEGTLAIIDDLANEIDSFTDSLERSEKEEPTFEVTSDSLFISKQIIESAIASQDKINKLIKAHTTSKCNKIENAIIFSAIAEHLAFSDTPKKVILNEYIELAKQFGTKSSASFMNAFLDKAI